MRLLYIGTALAMLFTAAEAEAGLRCDGRVVSRTHTPLEVRSICGEPNNITRRLEERVFRRRHPQLGWVERRRTVEIEQWTYVPGDNRFIRTVIFENGRLIDVQTEGKPPKAEGDLEQCQRSIHSRGDTLTEVLLRCGPPADITQWYEEETVGDINTEHTRVIRYERWTYNFGPTRFLRFFTFADGRLVEKSTGNKGF